MALTNTVNHSHFARVSPKTINGLWGNVALVTAHFQHERVARGTGFAGTRATHARSGAKYI